MEKDKDKSHYLGNSIRNATGLWAKRKGDLEWFTKEKVNEGGPALVELDEIADIKRKEAEAMAQALGATNPVSGSHEYDQHINDMIKKELKEKSTTYQGEKIVGLGMKGSSRRDVVMATKREYRQTAGYEDKLQERGRTFEPRKGGDDDEKKRDKKEKKDKKKKRSRSRSRTRRSRSRSRERNRYDRQDRNRSRERREREDRDGRRRRSRSGERERRR